NPLLRFLLVRFCSSFQGAPSPSSRTTGKKTKVEWTVMATVTVTATATATATLAEVVPAAVALLLVEVVPAAVAPLLVAVRPPEVRSDPEGERLPAECLQAGRRRQVG